MINIDKIIWPSHESERFHAALTTIAAFSRSGACQLFCDISPDTVYLLEKVHGTVHVIQVEYTDTYIMGMPDHSTQKLANIHGNIRDADVSHPITVCLFETDKSSTKSAKLYSSTDREFDSGWKQL